MLPKDREKDLAPVTRRLDALIRLIAVSLPKEINQTKKIEILSGTGLAPKEIADILGTTANTVSVTLAGLKKKTAESQKQQPPDSSPDSSQERLNANGPA